MSKRNIDRGYAWVVLAAGCVVNVVMGMTYYSTGVVNKAVLERMGEGVVKTSWVGSTFLGAIMFSGPLAGSLTNALGCRSTIVFGGLAVLLGLVGASFARNVDTLIASYGIVLGLGLGLVTTAASVAVGHYFDKLRPLAAGILVSGAGFGMLSGAPLVRLLFDSFGLSGMFLLLGALGSHICVAGMLVRPSIYEDNMWSKQRTKSQRHTEERRTFRNSVHDFCSVLCECAFMLYVLSFALWSFGESAFQVHLPNYAEQKGTSPQQSAMLFTAMGIPSTIARILTGFAGSDPAIGTILLHTGMLGVAGVMVMLIPLFSSTYTLQLVVSALYGLYAGGPMALLNPICVELLGVKRLASGYGMNNLFSGIGLLLGPPFAGLVFDITGNFDASFFLAGSTLVIGSLISLAIVSFKKADGPTINTNLDVEIMIYGESEGDDPDNTDHITELLMSTKHSEGDGPDNTDHTTEPLMSVKWCEGDGLDNTDHTTEPLMSVKWCEGDGPDNTDHTTEPLMSVKWCEGDGLDNTDHTTEPLMYTKHSEGDVPDNTDHTTEPLMSTKHSEGDGPDNTDHTTEPLMSTKHSEGDGPDNTDHTTEPLMSTKHSEGDGLDNTDHTTEPLMSTRHSEGDGPDNTDHTTEPLMSTKHSEGDGPDNTDHTTEPLMSTRHSEGDMARGPVLHSVLSATTS